MANGLHASYKPQLLDATFPLLSTALDISLLDAGTVALNLATQDFYDDLVTAEVATFADLASKTTTSGAFDAADVTFTSVSGSSAEYFTIFEDDATDATSSLIVSFDTATGLPVTPNGGDITITWAASIFSIA